MKFTINYPSHWIVGRETGLSSGTEIEFRGQEGERVTIVSGCHYNQEWMRNYTLEEWIDSHRKWSKKYQRRVDEKKIRLSGTNAVDFIHEEAGRIVHDVYCGGGNKIYDIEISADPSQNDFLMNGSRWMLYSLTVDAIRTGKVKIDVEWIKKIQKHVDDGHQPWMMNPVMVWISDMVSYGFDRSDPIPDLERVDRVRAQKEFSIEVTHMGRAYIVTLIQPVAGLGKIWAVSDVEEK